MTIMERAQAPDFWSWRESILCYHIYARRLLNLFMEMNCVRETFIRLSGLTVIVDSVSVSVSLDDTVPADGLVNLRVEKSSANGLPGGTMSGRQGLH